MSRYEQQRQSQSPDSAGREGQTTGGSTAGGGSRATPALQMKKQITDNMRQTEGADAQAVMMKPAAGGGGWSLGGMLDAGKDTLSSWWYGSGEEGATGEGAGDEARSSDLGAGPAADDEQQAAEEMSPEDAYFLMETVCRDYGGTGMAIDFAEKTWYELLNPSQREHLVLSYPDAMAKLLQWTEEDLESTKRYYVGEGEKREQKAAADADQAKRDDFEARLDAFDWADLIREDVVDGTARAALDGAGPSKADKAGPGGTFELAAGLDKSTRAGGFKLRLTLDKLKCTVGESESEGGPGTWNHTPVSIDGEVWVGFEDPAQGKTFWVLYGIKGKYASYATRDGMGVQSSYDDFDSDTVWVGKMGHSEWE